MICFSARIDAKPPFFFFNPTPLQPTQVVRGDEALKLRLVSEVAANAEATHAAALRWATRAAAAGPAAASTLLATLRQRQVRKDSKAKKVLKEISKGSSISAPVVACPPNKRAAVLSRKPQANAVDLCLCSVRGLSVLWPQDVGLAASLQREAAAQALCYATADFREGLAAVGAKRTPTFTGR
jgi:enoyl-CoA hydratase/carnithine racemase